MVAFLGVALVFEAIRVSSEGETGSDSIRNNLSALMDWVGDRGGSQNSAAVSVMRTIGYWCDPIMLGVLGWGSGTKRRGSALCAQPFWRTGGARSDATAVVRVEPRAIERTRRGSTRRARVRPRPPVQSLCPLDAWQTLRDEPWRRYRHHFTND
jgi:hypothetical protein